MKRLFQRKKISFPELTEHHLRRMLITNIVLQLRLSEGLTQVNGLILITPSNVPKSSKWSELRLTCSGELFTFFVHTDSLCHHCAGFGTSPLIPSLLSEDGSGHFRGDSSHLVSEVHKTSVCTGVSLLNV